MLPNALRVTLRPPPGVTLTIGLHTGGSDYRLRVEDGWILARRGRAEDAELTLAGTPWEVMATLLGHDGEGGAEVGGGAEALERLRAMVTLPEAHREGAMAELASLAT